MGVAETKNKVHGQISPKNKAIEPSLSEILDFEVPGVFRTWPKCLLIELISLFTNESSKSY